MAEREGERARLGVRGSALPDRVWVGLLVLLALAVALRIGALDLFAAVATAGGAERLPNPYATVDHPFHAVRAETLRRALAEGDLLRWVGHHQGGYPVEFYPLGVAWLEVGVWALLLGAVPVIAVHKVVVGLIFLLPGAAYGLMARRDGWPLSVAFLALAAHVVVPGGWWHGGYTELVQWGLVTNVAASVALLFVLPWLTTFLLAGGRSGAAAGLAAAFAVYANPRSLIPLAVVAVGAWLTVAVRADGSAGPQVRVVTRRLVLVGVLTAALAAPELISLLRFGDLYAFVRYETYDGFPAYLRSARDAVSLPVFLLGIGGVVAGLALPARPVTRAAAASLLLYVAVTLLLVAEPGGRAAIAQLEATRLMPFQRLLTIYLAAVALHVAVRWLSERAGLARPALVDAVQIAAVAALAVAFVAPGNARPEPANPPVPERGLFEVQTAAAPQQVAFEEAVGAADGVAAPGTALLVIGSALSWHQQLWAPLWTDRPLFSNDWLWNWHPWHAGPPGYDPRGPHYYPYPELALDRAYLDRHAIGAVVVADTPTTTAARIAAASSPDLVHIGDRGPFDLYAVRDPTTIVTAGDANATDLLIENHRLSATVEGEGGEAIVRRTWHPRWRAIVDGEPVPIARTDGGYMSVPVTPGQVRVELSYEVGGVDWVARAVGAVGIIVASVPFLRARRGRRSLAPAGPGLKARAQPTKPLRG